MECNKEEAARAKSIAESKILEKDFGSAKKFALKAQNLSPGLYGIAQMLTTLNVYISSEKMINGKVDWYGVLDVSPTADKYTIKKQYRKLALLLHPDKNSSVGADGAFILISEAWGLLKDKAKRSDYNILTGRKKVTANPGPTTVFTTAPFPQPGQSNHTGSPFTQPGGPPTVFSSGPFAQPGGPSNHTGSSFAQPGGPSTVFPGGPFAQPGGSSNHTGRSFTQPGGPTSFWTVCNKCRIQYEYRIIFRNLFLLCPKCIEPFLAKEIPRTVSKSKSPKPNPRFPFDQQQQGPVENVNGNKPEAWKTGTVPAPAGVNSSASPSVVTKVTTSRNKKKRPMSASG